METIKKITVMLMLALFLIPFAAQAQGNMMQNRQKMMQMMQDSTMRSMMMNQMMQDSTMRMQMMRRMSQQGGMMNRGMMMQRMANMMDNPQMRQRVQQHITFMQAMLDAKTQEERMNLMRSMHNMNMMGSQMNCMQMMQMQGGGNNQN